MTLGTILLIVLILLLVGALPSWGYSRSWGYGPTGGLGLVVVIVVVLLVMGESSTLARPKARRARAFFARRREPRATDSRPWTASTCRCSARRATGAREGRAVWLVTVLETWGSAPRPPGALLAMRDDGLVVGSVSGGCVEDDLIDRVRNGERVGKPSLDRLRRQQGRGGALRPALRRQPAPGAGAARRHRAGSTRSSSAPPGTSWSRASSISTAARSASRPRGRGEAFSFDGTPHARALRPALADARHRRRPALARARADGARPRFRGRRLRPARGIPPRPGTCPARPSARRCRTTWRSSCSSIRTPPSSPSRTTRSSTTWCCSRRSSRRRSTSARSARAATPPGARSGCAVRPDRGRDRAAARADRARHRQPHAGRDRGLDPGRDRGGAKRRRA